MTARDRAVWLVTATAVVWLLATAILRLLPAKIEAPAPAELDPPPQARVLTADLPEEPVRVQVLNGCGAPQAAARLTRRARALGLDVIDEGNADSFGFLESMVIDRRGDMTRARLVAELLGIPVCIQQITHHPSFLAEVSVVIGRDHEQLGLLGP